MDYRLRGARMYERETLAPTEENRRMLEGQLSAARAQVEALEAPEPAFALMKRHFCDFLDGARVQLDNAFSKPAAAVAKLTRRLSDLTGVDTREDAEKADVLRAQLEGLEELLAGVERCARAASAEGRRRAGRRMRLCRGQLPPLRAERRGVLSRALRGGSGRAGQVAHERGGGDRRALSRLRGRGGGARGRRGTPRSIFGSLLSQRAVRPARRRLDELLRWHRSEMERTRAEVLKSPDGCPSPNVRARCARSSDALARYAGPCDSPEEMFQRMRGYLERAREAAREYVWFPEEACRLERVPYPLRDSFPWGGYSDGDGRLRPIAGTAFLNDGNFRAISDGWLKMQAVHEAYPGHHIQYVRNVTDALPETVKLGAKHIPLIEGVAHRSERLFEFVFAEDPFYPLFVAFRRHHTAVRIRSDLMLRLEGRPIRDCVRLYMDELGFDHAIARGQVRAQEQMEGYFTCYYYGMKRIADFEAKYGADSRSFTEELFSSGNVSMENLEGFLRLDEAQRRSYRNDFPSLLMDPADVSTLDRVFAAAGERAAHALSRRGMLGFVER